jgi:hypothetical protein
MANLQNYKRVKIRANDISTLPEPWLLSINRNLGDIWFLPGNICKIYFVSRAQYMVYPPYLTQN